MIATDRLRFPSPLDVSGGAYKEWLHVNLFDPVVDSIGLFNLSLHGSPSDPRSLAVAAVVWAEMDGPARARVDIAGLADGIASATDLGIERRLRIQLDPTDSAVTVEALLPDEGSLRMTCRPIGPVIVAETPVPFGSGWIAWRALPRMSVAGSVARDGARRSLEGALAYHDHNWGRWHWGDDAGWEWAAFLAGDGVTVVMSRTTDRAHRRGSPVLHVVTGTTTRRFVGPAVRFVRSGRFEGRLTRLPGAMAALHSGRMAPSLPAGVRIEADDGIDQIELEFTPVHACQLITADPIVPGHGFIHELMGRFVYSGQAGGTAVEGSGLGVFEHVD